jgi:hypothetical protein
MTTTFTRLACALALTAGLAGAAHADNTTYVFLNPVGATTTFSGAINDVIAAAGSFTETFVTFGAPAASDMTFTAAAGAGITFTGITLSYWLDTTTLPLGSATVTGTSINATAPDQISGTYQWVVTGVAATAGASITGTILEDTNIAAPVPEPETWALMLGGLGLMALNLGRRRRL